VPGSYKEGIQQGKYDQIKPYGEGLPKGYGKYQEGNHQGKYEQRKSYGETLPKSVPGKYQEGIQPGNYDHRNTYGITGKGQQNSFNGKDQYKNYKSKSYFSENDIEREVDRYLEGK
jgi:hypothetical protein